MKRVIIKRGETHAMAAHVRTGYKALLAVSGNRRRARVSGVTTFLTEKLGHLEGHAAFNALKRMNLIRAIGLDPANKRLTIWEVKRVPIDALGYGHTKFHVTKSRHGVHGQRKRKRICSGRGVIQTRIKHGECKHSVMSESLIRRIAKEAGFRRDIEPVQVIVHLIYKK